MAQLTIYLPDDLESKARRVAKAERTTVSRWVAQQVSRRLSDSWPPEVLAAAGAVADFPDLETIRAGYGKDTKREKIR
jgi:hypothetical protein